MKIAFLVLAALQALNIHTSGAPVLSVLDTTQALIVPPPANIETVHHKKEANGGYKQGSPLYNKQERIEAKVEKKDHKHGKHGHKHAAAARKTQAHHAQGSSSKMPTLTHTLASTSVYVVLVLAFAYMYQKKAGAPPLGEKAQIGASPMALPAWTRCGFAYSFLDCGNLETDWSLYLTAYCCPIVQWASSASKSLQPFMGYWKAVVLLLALTVLAPFTYGLTSIVIMFILMKRRRELRKQFNHSHTGPLSLMQDCCITASGCLCCQLVQEAREVDYTSPSETA